MFAVSCAQVTVEKHRTIIASNNRHFLIAFLRTGLEIPLLELAGRFSRIKLIAFSKLQNLITKLNLDVQQPESYQCNRDATPATFSGLQTTEIKAKT